MAGTKEGGRAAAATNRSRYGEDYYSKLGKTGGKWKGRKGTAAMNPEKLREMSARGGKKSRRSKSDRPIPSA